MEDKYTELCVANLELCEESNAIGQCCISTPTPGSPTQHDWEPGTSCNNNQVALCVVLSVPATHSHVLSTTILPHSCEEWLRVVCVHFVIKKLECGNSLLPGMGTADLYSTSRNNTCISLLDHRMGCYTTWNARGKHAYLKPLRPYTPKTSLPKGVGEGY